ncbi:hypothetical protein A2U01_0092563, partial [Trifolium medium]|nr:hypothetical protein [Trifolium medium]
MRLMKISGDDDGKLTVGCSGHLHIGSHW